MSEQERADLHTNALLAAGWTRRARENPWASGWAPGWLNPAGQAKSCPPLLTLDWMHALRRSFTEDQQDQYHTELCEVLRPDCVCNIVGTWDMIQATVEQHAKAYIATMTKYEQPRLEKTRAHDKSTV